MILAPTLTLSAGSGAAIVRPTFSRDFAGEKTLNNGTGPAITFTRASGGTYFDSNGVLQTASNDVPRFDHNPATGASRGLLIEEARTNSVRNSQAGGAVAGTSGTMPTNWSSTVSPAGLTREIVGTGTSNGMSYVDIRYSGTATSSGGFGIFFEQALATTTTTGSTWTTSFYCALVAGSVSNINGIQAGVYFGDTVAQLEFYRSANIAGSMTSSLRRFSQTATAANAGTTRVAPLLEVSYGNTQVIDFTLRIAAPQLEQGAFPTSYIPTTNAAATRSADSAVVTPISSFYNQAEGTLFAEASRPQVAKNVTFMAFIDGANANNVSALETGVAVPTQQRFQVAASGTALAQLLYSAAGAANTVYKMVGTYAANDFIAAQNGVLTSPDTSGTTPTTMTRLSVGLSTTDTNAGYGNSAVHLRKIAYYPKRLSNTLLQQLTT